MFYLFYAALCVVLSTLTAIGTDISLWWQPLLATLYLYGAFLLHIIVYMAVAFSMRKSQKVNVNSRLCRIYFRETFHFILRMMRVRIWAQNSKVLPKRGEPFLLVCNHLSHFDPMVVCTYLRRHRMIFISKPENFDLLPVAPYMKRLGFLAIDRVSPKNAMRTIRDASLRMSENRLCVGVYPEGTISRDGVFAGFHEGVFLAAKKAGVPVVVTTMWGTQHVKKRFWHIGSDVRFRFEGVISKEEVAELRPKELSDKARDMMRPTILEYGMQAPTNELAEIPELAALQHSNAVQLQQ
ncbi:MAG: 1-acyl-sn-glycerol-3-phosphate acyltransferase [Clostridia bacterium]|nr:1-acyl-sn-glycerol-3-phosphate acyltransferase [Clostridia bacterium]MBO7150373.1 1-acyl-sn-glycerol-3-phosphate acyltransferase [Clostridia bacterium]